MKNTNKGMAFVTVLIATMFIGLLATSLCFMAYNNYLTKSTRWSAENNFYYDEFALNELTTTMRQQAEKVSLDKVAEFNNNPPTDPAAVAPDPLKEFYKELAHCTGVKNAAGAEDDGNYNGVFVGTWDPAKMNNLIGTMGITSSADVTVTVSVPNEAGGTRNDPTYRRDKKEVTFKNVRIKVTDNNSGYTTTITTDILMPTKGVSAKIPVNEFCLMSDSPLDWSSGGIVHVGGNVFSIDNAHNANHDFAHTAQYAAKFDKSSQVTLGGRKSLFVGDVYVTGNSRLTLYNEVTITGELKVDPGSRVECNGSNIKIGSISESSKKNVVGSYVEDPAMADRASSTFNGSTGDLKNGLASAIPNDIYFIQSFNNTTNTPTIFDGYTSAKGTCSLDAMNKAQNLNHNDVANTNMQYGTSAKVYYRGGSDDITDQSNKLMFMAGNNQKLRGDFTNTTIIAPVASAVHSQDPTKVPYMTRLSDADYYACLNTLISQADMGSISPKSGGINLNSTVGYTGTIDDFNAVIAQSKLTPADAGYDPNFSDKWYVSPTMPTLGKETRYYVYDKTNGKQLIPWKYFIRDDADEIIGNAFNNIRNDSSDGGEYNIVFVNWVKE